LLRRDWIGESDARLVAWDVLIMCRIVEGVKAQGRVAKRPVNESRGGGLGPGIWAGR